MPPKPARVFFEPDDEMVPACLHGDKQGVPLIAVAFGENVGFEDDLSVAVEDDRAETGYVEFQFQGGICPIPRPCVDELLAFRFGKDLIEVCVVAIVFASQDASPAIGPEGQRMRRILPHIPLDDAVEGFLHLPADPRKHALMIFKVISHGLPRCYSVAQNLKMSKKSLLPLCCI